MRIIVYGAGGVGGAFAARLHEGGHDVSVIARGVHLDAIRTHGLELDDGLRVTRHRLEAMGPGERPTGRAPDLILVTLKATALPMAAGDIAALSAGAPVIFAANGVPWWLGRSPSAVLRGWRSELLDPGGRLQRAFEARDVQGGVIFSGNMVVAPGRVRNTSHPTNRLVIGSVDGGELPVDIARALSVGGLDVLAVPDPTQVMWRKLLFNVAFNPLSVAVAADQGRLSDDAGLMELARGMAMEALAVARAAGADLDEAAVAEIMEAGRGQGRHKSSMLQDFEAGRPLELDAVLGALVELGQALALTTPLCGAMYAITGAQARFRVLGHASA